MTISQKGLSILTSSGEPVCGSNERVFSQELVLAIGNYIWLLAIGPIAVALVAYLVVSQAPHQYRSTALLRIDRPAARSMVAFLTSPPVANQILSRHGTGGDTPETRATFLIQQFRLTDPEPAAERAGERLYRLDFDDSDPQRAQAIATDLIQTWLASTRPIGTTRDFLEAELDRNKIAAAVNTQLIDELQKETETTKLVVPNSLSGELATPISALIAKRDQNSSAVNRLSDQLKGITADVILVPPHLPQSAIPTRAKAIPVLFGIGTLPVLLALVLLCRYLAPGQSPHRVILRRFRPAA